MSEPVSLHWLPEALCAQVAQELHALLADFCSRWGLPVASDVQVSVETHAAGAGGGVLAPVDLTAPWTDPWRDAVTRALFDLPLLADSAILRGVLDRIEKDLQQRLTGKFGGAVGALPAAFAGHAGLVCRFDWLQSRIQQRLSCAQLRTSGWLKRPTSSSALARVDLEQALARTPVPLVARLGSAIVNVGDLLHLAPGDVLLLSEPLDEPLRINSPGSALSLRALLGSTAGSGQASPHHRGFRCLPH